MISHKLNEITAISDSVTVIRDGKTVETLSLESGEVTQERIIRGMVGRDLESFYPERESKPGEEVLRGRGLDRLAPHPGPQGRRRRRLQRPRRRGRRHRRADGARAGPSWP
jgi:ABC-type uncharacterized transport system ATPase subunit